MQRTAAKPGGEGTLGLTPCAPCFCPFKGSLCCKVLCYPLATLSSIITMNFLSHALLCGPRSASTLDPHPIFSILAFHSPKFS